MASPAYDELVSLARELQLLKDTQAVLGWDQEVLSPKKATAYRGEQISLLSGMVHERWTADKVGDLIETAQSELGEEGSIDQLANLREFRHSYGRSRCLPREHVEEFARTRVEAQSTWASAREANDFSSFEPVLSKLIDLSKKSAELWGYEEHLYDALVDQFERGTRTSDLKRVLGDMRQSLVPVVSAATAKWDGKNPLAFVEGSAPVAAQEAFNRKVAESIGFDFDAGRIDTAVHPFCSGMGPLDTRLTTRYHETNFLSSLFGVLHEAGHGLYDQGTNKDWHGLPAGEAVSLGVHESQSRLWENHVGRSRPFWEKWLPVAKEHFPHLQSVTVEQMLDAVNFAEKTFIRVEADEVTYDLHVLLRFEIELAIFSGDLEVKDIPAAWNEKFREFFDLEVPDAANGCLQDIHWSMAIFGYFPTYSLGNLNAAHLMKAALQDSAVRDGFDSAEYQPLLAWMRREIHQQGSIYAPNELVTKAAGSPVSVDALREHLESRYC